MLLLKIIFCFEMIFCVIDFLKVDMESEIIDSYVWCKGIYFGES